MAATLYADYDYYKTEYMRGREPAIAERDFPYFAERAGNWIDYLTGKKLFGVTDIPVEVKNCTCAVARLLLNEEQAQSRAGEEIILPTGVSVQRPREADPKETAAQIRHTIGEYLAHTGLLYRGL
jgi:hypothetical protein